MPRRNISSEKRKSVIHESALVDSTAKIGKNVSIGPYSVIDADVEIGDNTCIGPHVVIKGQTKIGKNNKIFQFCSLGEEPQAKVYSGEKTSLEIGDNNYIREFATLNRGTMQGGGVTRIANNNFIMANVHIAHDCQIGSHIIFSNNVALSGHVVVEDSVVFGGCSAVHQFCRVGSYAFIAGETSTGKDIPPYILVSGHPASVYGLNIVGLRRNGFDDATIAGLRKAYNIIYRKGLTSQQAVHELEILLGEHKEVSLFIDALNKSTRGIVR